MRKFKKIAVIAVASVMAASVPLGLTACTADGSGHAHTYADTYTYNETNHYRRATCEGHGHLFTDNGTHTFEGSVCTVCGYDNSKPLPDNPSGGDGEDGDDTSGGGNNGGNQGGDTAGPDDNNQGSNPSTPSQPDKPAAAPEVVTAGVEFTKYAGDLESSYVEWNYVEGAEWYNVYVKADTESESAWKKLDDGLVRQYTKYFRADAVGLKAAKTTGTNYSMRVVPVNAQGKEMTEKGGTVKSLTVYPHDRTGFAFVGDVNKGDRVIPGAYNEDGTLKDGAKVLYITEDNMDTVTLDVVTSGKGAVTTATGIYNIFLAYNKGYETAPLDVRMVGEIRSDYIKDAAAAFDKGDLVISNGQSGTGITFEGIGDDATANGWGIRVKGASMVEIRNLGFINCKSDEGDNIGLQQNNDHIWVHNNDMFYGGPGGDSDQAKGDGALDTKKTDYVTHSYNHFWDSGKCNLMGMKSEKPEYKITFHHNWYDHSDSRHPRIRTTTVHIYNNYFDGNAKYGVGATMGSNVFVENNYFRSTAKMRPIMIAGQGTDMQGTKDEQDTFSGETGGMIKAYGNYFDCPADKLNLIVYSAQNSVDFDCYEVANRADKVPSAVKTLKGGNSYSNFDTSDWMYDYAVDTPELAKEKTVKWAGRVGGGDISFTFDNAKEDGNYAVIPELKALITGYKSLIVSIGKPSSK